MTVQSFFWILTVLCGGSVACAADASDAPVAAAAEERDFSSMKRLLSRGANVNAAQVDGMTALHWAVYHDDTESVQALLRAGATVTVENRYKVTPLSLACANGNGDVVELLLKAGANANAELDGGETALMTAARTGRTRPVELLLEHHAEVNEKAWRGQTALMWAAAEGHAEVLQQLLDAGADPDIQLKSGYTAWFFAARHGRIEAAKTLLKAGVDVNAIMDPVKPNGKAPRKGMTALILAVENGHFELAATLLDAGADPDDQRSGFTALHALTWVRKPNRGDGPDGEPPPRGSGSLTSLQFVHRVVAAGGDINVRLKRGKSGRGRLNQTGSTPFLMAADTADLPLMRLLLDLGADPHIPNADDCTALMAAAGIGTYAPGEEAGTEQEAMAAVRLLLDLGFDINHVDRNGETAMHGAAYASWPQMARLLFDHGADIDIWHSKNKYGWTPLLIAQGHRAGNFKPAAATMEAIAIIMKERGVQPEKAKPFKGGNEYSRKKKPKN